MVLILVGLSFCATAVRAQDPADEFLKAYFLIQDGDTAKKANEKDKAIEKYNGALDVLKKIQAQSPEWNSNIISFRTRYCADNITALGGKVGNASAAAPSKAASTEATPSVAVPDQETAKQLANLQNELSDTRKQLEQVRKEKDDLEVKVRATEENLKSVTAGKGDARIQELQKENEDLRKQLGAAEEKLKGISAGGAAEGALTQIQQELTETKKQLEAALQENEKLRKDNEELRTNLEDARTKLKALASNDETIKTLQRENALLRAIVERAYQEDAKRGEQKNQIKTDFEDQKARVSALEQQIAALSTPLTPLSAEERELLKNPSIVIREPEKAPTPETPASTGAPTTPTAGTTAAPAAGTTGAAEAKEPPKEAPAPKKMAGQNVELAKDARAAYEKGDFEGAASKYEAILKDEPNNIFALSNLGVIRFRQDRLGEAETLLNKALDLDPTDAFSRSVLGIIYYKQGSYDEAISELTRSIALDSKAPESHNYLGITYSQKGYQEAAEKELLKAVELNPNYGDAHFNLSVVYATQKPPAISLARKHYKRALELGVPADPELEKLFAK